jgi:4-amino-4-deoxy-L-arabinose transferase-like glycosyltransferase
MVSGKSVWLAIFLILFGTFIRILGLSIFPAGFNQDEASIGYETFSLLHDGFDRNGSQYPVHLISWGNGQNALYAYLLMPIVQLFGLTPFSVRLLNALLSSLSLLVFYLLFKSAFSRKKALVALAFLVICPWSIMAARWGLESNIFPVIFLIAVFFLFKGITKNQVYYLLSVVFFAMSLYAYGTSYLVVPLFFLFIFVYLIIFKKISWKFGVLSVLLFLILAFPMILFVLINQLDLETIQIGEITIPKMISDRTSNIFNIFSGNFFVTLSKNIVRFLSIVFLQTDKFLFNAIPSFGLIYHISLPFFFLGLYFILKQKIWEEPVHFVMLAWIACSVILGITTHANINRVNIIVFPMIYFTLQGLFYFVKEIVPEIYRTKCKHFLVLFYSIFFLFFAGYYASVFNEKNKEGFAYGLAEAIEYVNETFPKDTINITTHSINMPYIYVCFFSKTDPVVFRETVVYDHESLRNGFGRVLSFDRYHFVADATTKENITIISKEEFWFSDVIKERKCENFGNYYVIFSNEN